MGMVFPYSRGTSKGRVLNYYTRVRQNYRWHLCTGRDRAGQLAGEGGGLESAVLARPPGTLPGCCVCARACVRKWDGGWPSTSRPPNTPTWGVARNSRAHLLAAPRATPPGLSWTQDRRALLGPADISKDKLPLEIPGSESTLAKTLEDSDFLFLREERISTCSRFQTSAQTPSRNTTHAPKNRTPRETRLQSVPGPEAVGPPSVSRGRIGSGWAAHLPKGARVCTQQRRAPHRRPHPLPSGH